MKRLLNFGQEIVQFHSFEQAVSVSRILVHRNLARFRPPQDRPLRDPKNHCGFGDLSVLAKSCFHHPVLMNPESKH